MELTQLKEEQEMILRILEELRLSRKNESYFSAVEIGQMVFPSSSQAGIVAAANLKSLRNKKLVNDIIIYDKTSAVCMWKISDKGIDVLDVERKKILSEYKQLKNQLETAQGFVRYTENKLNEFIEHNAQYLINPNYKN